MGNIKILGSGEIYFIYCLLNLITLLFGNYNKTLINILNRNNTENRVSKILINYIISSPWLTYIVFNYLVSFASTLVRLRVDANDFSYPPVDSGIVVYVVRYYFYYSISK